MEKQPAATSSRKRPGSEKSDCLTPNRSTGGAHEHARLTGYGGGKAGQGDDEAIQARRKKVGTAAGGGKRHAGRVVRVAQPVSTRS